MESIVSLDKSLRWDGWTVIHTKFNPMAWKNTNGIISNGKWYTATRYEPTSNGWDLPKKMVNNNGQA